MQISISGTMDLGCFSVFLVVLGPTNNDFCPRITPIFLSIKSQEISIAKIPIFIVL